MKSIMPTNQDPYELGQFNDMMQQAGQAANEHAAPVAFEDHTARKANNTIRRKIEEQGNFQAKCQRQV